jgi:putative transposase
VTDGKGKPVLLHLTAGQVSNYKGAEMLGDRGYDADWFRNALIEKGIAPCIPPRKNRKVQCAYDKTLYKQRHKIENMFGWLKDWRRIAMRYDRCAHTFFSAVCIAAIVIFCRRLELSPYRPSVERRDGWIYAAFQGLSSRTRRGP